MRKVVPAVLLLAVAGCSTHAHWEKPGATEQMTVADAVDCRRAATREAFVYNPEGMLPPLWPPTRRGYWLYWQQLQDTQRLYAENRLTAFCMRNKGYELLPTPEPQR